MQADDIPYGYCHCGCGEKTRIIAQNDPRHGHVKGEPMRYLKAHHHRGKVVSEETRARLSAAVMGKALKPESEAGYRSLHSYLCAHFPKTGTCEECGRKTRTVYALIHGREYSRNREDYLELCQSCHIRGDHEYKPWNTHPEPRTHCPNGHEYTETNTIYIRGKRHCATCRRSYLDRRAKRERDARTAAREGR